MNQGASAFESSVDPMPSAMGQSQNKTRFATYNVSLYRKEAGQLIESLSGGSDKQAHKLATVIQRVRPDVLLVNEFDYDEQGEAAELFCTHYLGEPHTVGGNKLEPLSYPYRYSAESNTGLTSGTDLDGDGKNDGLQDCYGFGAYPGQYGMLVLSKYPIREQEIRTFQKFRWKDMPNANLPRDPNSGEPYYSEDALNAFRLSSKSHWDVPIEINGIVIHFLVCHPTPPVFDGPEDRNGKRNHDEIRLLADYVDPSRSSYIVDDQGRVGGLESISGPAYFVIAGDLNADPHDGDSHGGAARQLIEHPLVHAEPTPSSKRAAQLGGDGANASHMGNPAHDTADFDDRRVGNLRIDYVLPSKNLNVVDSGVFWPDAESAFEDHVKATDHRLVFVDIDCPRLPE